MKRGIAILFLGVLTCHCGLTQSAGTFTATGNLITPRTQHSATLLPDGMVLIAGGATRAPNPDSILDSAELYDPATGVFTPTGSMTAARWLHTATLLANGAVLIIGGLSSSSVLASAEIYNPTTRTFAPAGKMIVPRAGHSATLLNNGKVLIVGGGTGPIASSTAELYDPSTGTFTPAGDVPIGLHRATLLATGKVLIVPSGENIHDQAALYDAGSGTFKTIGTFILVGGVAYAANLVNSGAVLVVVVPVECDSPEAEAEVYDPVTQTFSATGKLVTPRCQGTGTSLSDGSVLVAGGDRCVGSLDGGISCGNSYSAELYDPASQKFTRTGDMIAARNSFTTTLLKDGAVLIAGGIDAIGQLHSLIAGAELYHPLSVTPPPALFSLSGDGSGQGAIWHAATGQAATAGAPAVAGEVLSMYTTSLTDGSVIPPQVAIGGQLVEILFFGKAPGYPGFNQVNVRVPDAVASGSAVPVRLTYLGRPSNEVTIAVH